jgi:hypothetical protein
MKPEKGDTMFTSSLFAPSAMTLAVLAAATGIPSMPAHADTLVAVAGSADIERNNSASILTRVKADYAHAHGITGQGVMIAVMDSGISAAHREFSGPDKLAPGFNAINGGTDVSDRSGHGTHVAGIIAANRDGKGMYGIAYDATLLPIKVFPDSGSGSTATLERGLRYAIGKASIVNMSVGAAGSYDARGLRDAVRAGLLVVAAAGNEQEANPGWPARFAKESWANNQIIAVGAVDSANRLSSFSNRAGDTAAWYLVAPGISIASSYLNGQYAYMSGTSMATPIVSGAAALVKQLWPGLRADQISTILFVTATDLGAPGIDAVYGRGLLNVEKALQPIGTVTTTTFNGKSINVLAGATQPSSATSRLWNLAASGQLRVLGLDDFQRDFQIDLGATVSRPAAMSLEQVFGDMERRVDVVERLLDDGGSLSVAYERPLAGGMRRTPDAAHNGRIAAFSLLSAHDGGTETALGAGGSAGNYFGAGELHLEQGVSLEQVAALAPPYFTLLPGAAHAAIAHRVGDVKLKFGMLTTGLNRTFAAQDGYTPPASADLLPHASSALFEVSRSFGDAALSVSMSQTSESNAYLGSYSSGALSLGSKTSTSALQVAGALLLAPKVTLAGQAAYGVTPGGSGTDSLITEVTRARSNAFSLALVAADRIKNGDRMSVSLSQPMRAYAGRIVMDMLSGGSGSGTPSRERLIFSMVPLGREMRMEINYLAPAGALGSLGISLMVRRDPNNMVDVSVEKLLAVRFVTRF